MRIPIRLLILCAVIAITAACASEGPPARPSPTATAGPITVLPERPLQIERSSLVAGHPVSQAVEATPTFVSVATPVPHSTSTVVTVWNGRTSSTSTIGEIEGARPGGLVLMLEGGCTVFLDYDTGQVDQRGLCSLDTVAEAFWAGVNRYNPTLVGIEYKQALMAVGNLQRSVRELERRRDDLRDQVILLTDTLAVLRGELDARARERTPTPEPAR